MDEQTDTDDVLEVVPASTRDSRTNAWAAAAVAAAVGEAPGVAVAAAPSTAELEPWAGFDDSPLPPRRPRTVTPLTWVLGAALLASGAFAVGAKVGRSSAPAAAATGAGGFGAALREAGGGAAGLGAPTTTAGARAGGGARQGALGGGTFGTVKLVDGTNVYIQDASGNVVKVTTTGDSVVTVSKQGTAADLRPGDTIVVQGTTDAEGNIAATVITSGAGGFAQGRGPGSGGGAAGPTTTAPG